MSESLHCEQKGRMARKQEGSLRRTVAYKFLCPAKGRVVCPTKGKDQNICQDEALQGSYDSYLIDGDT